MPYLGIGLHILVALYFGIHAIRTGRSMYWLIILFSFPLLGSVVYFFAEYLPASKMERGVKKVSSKAMQLLDPSRELREARQAFDLTPTVQNRMRLAAALDNAGEYTEASEHFDACLSGPFANDPELCFNAAKAKLHVNQSAQAIQLLQDIRARKADFRPEQLSLLLAQSYAANQDNSAAQQEFVHALNSFGSAEVRGQYALWSARSGDIVTAERLRAELAKDWQHWNKHARQLHKPLFDEVDAAIAAGKKAS